jgi:hypothetical protein
MPFSVTVLLEFERFSKALVDFVDFDLIDRIAETGSISLISI